MVTATDVFQALFESFKGMDPMKDRDQRLFLLAGLGRTGTQADAIRVTAYLVNWKTKKSTRNGSQN